MQEFSLSSAEGVALMCLAEALLRIPDTATRDALIRDKIGHGDWRSHLGRSPSLFVNAATWGLMLTGRIAAADDESGLGAALGRVLARAGEPVIRRGMDVAMCMMGEQFVMGETIAEALTHARTLEARGFRYSYDMLGEAAGRQAAASRAGLDMELPGPVGEANGYSLRPRGTVLCHAATVEGLLRQLAACLATGNAARVQTPAAVLEALDGMPPALLAHVGVAVTTAPGSYDAILFEGSLETLRALLQVVATVDGPIRPVLALSLQEVAAGRFYPPDMLLAERSTSIDTAAAGGNASLMSL